MTGLNYKPKNTLGTLVLCCTLVLCLRKENVLQYLLNALIQTLLEDTESAVGRTFPLADIISPILVHFFPLIQSSECNVEAWTMVGMLGEGRVPEKYL